MNGLKKYYIGNSRNLEKIFQYRKIHSPTLIISSPPYYDLLDYEGVKGQIGFGQKDYDGYLTDVADVFQHCYELAEENSTFWLVRPGKVVCFSGCEARPGRLASHRVVSPWIDGSNPRD